MSQALIPPSGVADSRPLQGPASLVGAGVGGEGIVLLARCGIFLKVQHRRNDRKSRGLEATAVFFGETSWQHAECAPTVNPFDQTGGDMMTRPILQTLAMAEGVATSVVDLSGTTWLWCGLFSDLRVRLN